MTTTYSFHRAYDHSIGETPDVRGREMTILTRVYATLPDHHLTAIVDGHLAAMALTTTVGQLDWHAHAVELALDELARRLWGDVA